MKEYVFKIFGVHYAANPEAEAGQPDTEEMHVRTREPLDYFAMLRGWELCREDT
jgi:hypothetical protein